MRTKTRGEGNAQAKLNCYQVKSIRWLNLNGIGYRKLSRWFNISQQQIRRIIKRECWAWM